MEASKKVIQPTNQSSNPKKLQVAAQIVFSKKSQKFIGNIYDFICCDYVIENFSYSQSNNATRKPIKTNRAQSNNNKKRVCKFISCFCIFCELFVFLDWIESYRFCILEFFFLLALRFVRKMLGTIFSFGLWRFRGSSKFNSTSKLASNLDQPLRVD